MAESIHAYTLGAAEAVGWDNVIGSITAGKRADLIVLDDDNGISDVMVGGRWHVQNGTQQVFGEFEKTQETHAV